MTAKRSTRTRLVSTYINRIGVVNHCPAKRLGVEQSPLKKHHEIGAVFNDSKMLPRINRNGDSSLGSKRCCPIVQEGCDSLRSADNYTDTACICADGIFSENRSRGVICCGPYESFDREILVCGKIRAMREREGIKGSIE
jgi:hypothetical protein